MIQLNQIKKDFGKGEARQTILKGISLDIKRRRDGVDHGTVGIRKILFTQYPWFAGWNV